jgi:hypothetical protein
MLVHPLEENRFIKGHTIPRITIEQLRELINYEGEITDRNNLWMLPLLSDTVTSLGIMYEDKFYGTLGLNHSAMQRRSGTTWWQLIADMPTGINGQIKNFLVALSTWPLHRRFTLRVLIRGSRAMIGGGRWLQFYVYILLGYVTDLVVDCFDVNEYTEHFTMRRDNCHATVNRYVSNYTGDAREYDVVIDDAYVPGLGVPEWVPQSVYYSLKDHSRNLQPFFHAYESRVFSHPFTAGKSKCGCKVCDHIAGFTDPSDQDLIKRFTIILGYESCCDHVHGDVKAMRDVMTRMVSITAVQSPGEQRGVLALSKILPVTGKGDDVVLSVHGGSCIDRSLFNITEGFKCPVDYAPFSSSALFIGVDPSSFYFCPSDEQLSLQANRPFRDVMVVSGWDVVVPVANEVWVKSIVPAYGFEATGIEFNGYYKYCRPKLSIAPTAVVLTRFDGILPHVSPDLYAMGTYKSSTLLPGVLLAPSLALRHYFDAFKIQSENIDFCVTGPDIPEGAYEYVRDNNSALFLDFSVAYDKKNADIRGPQSFRGKHILMWDDEARLLSGWVTLTHPTHPGRYAYVNSIVLHDLFRRVGFVAARVITGNFFHIDGVFSRYITTPRLPREGLYFFDTVGNSRFKAMDFDAILVKNRVTGAMMQSSDPNMFPYGSFIIVKYARLPGRGWTTAKIKDVPFYIHTSLTWLVRDLCDTGMAVSVDDND